MTAAPSTTAERPASIQRRKRVMVSVWCLPEEKAALDAHAAQVGMSVSSFLRTLGLGHEPRSTIDVQAVRELARINADQGRLGGLLKLYLTNDEKLRAAHDPETLVGMIESLLQRLSACQTQLLGVAKRLV